MLAVSLSASSQQYHIEFLYYEDFSTNSLNGWELSAITYDYSSSTTVGNTQTPEFFIDTEQGVLLSGGSTSSGFNVALHQALVTEGVWSFDVLLTNASLQWSVGLFSNLYDPSGLLPGQSNTHTILVQNLNDVFYASYQVETQDGIMFIQNDTIYKPYIFRDENRGSSNWREFDIVKSTHSFELYFDNVRFVRINLTEYPFIDLNYFGFIAHKGSQIMFDNVLVSANYEDAINLMGNNGGIRDQEANVPSGVSITDENRQSLNVEQFTPLLLAFVLPVIVIIYLQRRQIKRFIFNKWQEESEQALYPKFMEKNH